MPFTPGYGETPLPHDELTALVPAVVEVLDKPITKAAVYDLEQGVQDQVSEELLAAAIEGALLLDELLSDFFVRDLHARLYGDIWVWAGRLRQRELNIGIAPEQIAVELRSCLDTIR
jgi:fido (protein-threonine AMPylation protein)